MTTVPLVFISFLSFGIPGSPSGNTGTPSYYPLPFSFPFYTIDIVHSSWGALQTVAETYEFWFLAFKIAEMWQFYPLSQLSTHAFPYGPIMASYFLNYVLINLIGAIFGYWISKTTFLEEYVSKRKTEKNLSLFRITIMVLAVATIILAIDIAYVFGEMRGVMSQQRYIKLLTEKLNPGLIVDIRLWVHPWWNPLLKIAFIFVVCWIAIALKALREKKKEQT